MCSRSSALSRSNCVRRTMTSWRCVDVVLEHFLERHHLRHEPPVFGSGTSASMITPNVDCIGGVLVQLVEHHARNGVALELDHDAHAVAIRFVAQIADALELLVAHELGDRSDELRAVDLVRHLGDDDLRLVRRFLLLDHGARAHDDLAASRLLIIVDPRAAVDVAARREIGTLDELAQISPTVSVGIVDQCDDRGDDLAQIVRRNVRRHANRDAARSVDQQIRHAGGSTVGSCKRSSKFGAIIDGFFVDVREHLDRDAREPASVYRYAAAGSPSTEPKLP